MMMDGKGCAILFALLAAAGMIIGMLLYWLGVLPWWAPLVGAALPLAAGALLLLYLIARWMADGSH